MCKRELPIANFMQVEEITSGLIRRLVPSSDLVPYDVRNRFGGQVIPSI